MEFPSVGAHCGLAECQSLSFLPFQCSFCSRTFCTSHRLPADHQCTQWSLESHANSVQLCPRCDRMVLTPRQHDPATILQEHLDRACSLHLLPPVQSIAVQCARPQCRRRDRVVQTCPDCGQTFCLGHRHPTDHGCPRIEERRKAAEEEAQRRRRIQAAVANKFLAAGAGSGTATDPGSGDQVLAKKGTPPVTAEEKQMLVKAKAEAAKAALAEAKAKVAARNTGLGAAKSTGSSASSLKAGVSEAAAPKIKKASRVVALMKMKKTAKGDERTPLSARVYVHIKSPLFPELDDTTVFVDKTWTVGRSLDKIIEWLKISTPKNEPFDAGKRFSIFFSKEPDGIPALLNMQDRLQQLSQLESGDIFYLAPANWPWK
ncbi:zinc finger, AN1-type domain [Mortierella alpina]|nr:zinc finger, AN1-type domain [Mortierella alpina]